MYKSDLTLGTQINLIKGIKCDWDCQSETETGGPFFLSEDKSLFLSQKIPKVDSANLLYNQLKVSLFYSWGKLVDGLYNRWYINDQNLRGNTIPFVLKRSEKEDEVYKEIYTKLGIIPEDTNSDANTGFALVTLVKSAGKFYLNPENTGTQNCKLQTIISELPNTIVEAAPFLSAFEKHGTHLVSMLEIGDFMYQVFVYDTVTLKGIEKRLGDNVVTGSLAVSFQQYTKLVNKNGGYIKYAGTLNIACCDPQFKSSLPNFKDRVNWLDSSIFMAIKKDNSGLLQQFKSLIPISCRLTNLSNYIEKTEQAQNWDYVFRSATYQKYQQSINPDFPVIESEYNYKEIYKSFQQPFATTISTSFLTLNQIRIDMDELEIFNPSDVKTVFIFADVVEISKNIFLPGENITIICHRFISYSHKKNIPVISFTEKGFDNFNIYCGKFDGVAEIRKRETNTHKLISEGQLYQSAVSSDKQVIVNFDKSFTLTPPLNSSLFTSDSLAYALWIPLQSAQVIINYPASEEAFDVAKLFVQWLSDILKDVSEKNEELNHIRLQALLLLKSDSYASTKRLTVPVLTYEAYKPSINAMISAVDAFNEALSNNSRLIQAEKEKERAYNAQKITNDNIQQIGQFLVESNRIMFEKENDIETYYMEIKEKQETMLEVTQNSVKDLEKKLKEQQAVLENATEELTKNVNAYIIEQTIKSALHLAGAILGIFSGYKRYSSSKALEGKSEFDKIRKTIIKIESFLTFVDVISDLYEFTDRTVHMAIKSSKAFEGLPNNIEQPTSLDWEEFDAEVYAVVAPLLTIVPYANTYLKETKIFSARGRKYIEAESEVTKIEQDIYLIEKQITLNQNQKDRLKSLTNIINSDDISLMEEEQINLFELGNILQSHAQKVSMKLVNTLTIQDSALQYYYLQQPTQITNYDTLSLKEMIVSQAEKSISALEIFPSKPSNLNEPYSLHLKNIPIRDLIDGYYSFTIPLGEMFLVNYVRVRIIEVEMKVDGIESTDSDKVNVRLKTSAHPFFDRGLNRETIEYNTIPQDFEYVYDLKTGNCVYTNKPADEFAIFYIKMTPFTTWTLSLPIGKSSENANIKFKEDTVDVTLRFHLQVIRLSYNELSLIKHK